jgi:hypothetical protein
MLRNWGVAEDFKFALDRSWLSTEFPFSTLESRKVGCLHSMTIDLINCLRIVEAGLRDLGKVESNCAEGGAVSVVVVGHPCESAFSLDRRTCTDTSGARSRHQGNSSPRVLHQGSSARVRKPIQVNHW